VVLTLKQHRERAYLSTRELAGKAGVGADTIWRIEGGNYKKLRPATMRKIAGALGVHPADIVEFIYRESRNVTD
jgi:transcriptional regulator with XRE-family HTH domain